MSVVVSIDARIVSPERALIPVFDRGFLYGDSVYEVMRTYAGVPFAAREHLDRLERSGSLIEIRLPMSRDAILEQVGLMLAGVDHGESYIRVIVTRGEGEIDLDPAAATDPHCVIIVKPYRPLPETLYREGASVLLVPSGRCSTGAVPGGSKTGNYLTSIMALGRARQQGHHEALLVEPGGLLAEGASSNVFVVRSGKVATPRASTGILPGITRRAVIERCRHLGIDVAEEDLVPADLESADEAFLTSTLREVLPVVRVGARTVGDGRPGPVTRRVHRAYVEYVQDHGPARRDA